MITITIDGREIRTEPGKTIIEAAFENGIYIPHFCWHPALAISGNCRMCLVEVEKMPKQVIACATYCTDGMVVHVDSEKAIQARNAVMEFILINHPLDCPICDEAGECKLQDYTYRYSVGESRFDENKNLKRKRDPLGPHVMFDAERCISCSRCIRFCEDIVHQPQLTFVNRGDRVTIETFPGKQLDNPYSMNVIDICPVGALTSREFRFKARVWDVTRTESVCPGCARGCNIDVWSRKNEILRLTPRENPAVNGWWMCDNGRVNSFAPAQAPDRIAEPMIRSGGGMKKVGWPEAISHAAFALRAYRKEQIAFLGSAFDTCEDNFALARFARELFDSPSIDFLRHVVPEDQDDVLIRADKTPNAAGAELAGVRPADAAHGVEGIIRGIGQGSIRALVVMDDDAASLPALRDLLPKLSTLVVIAANASGTTEQAECVLPGAAFAEKLGTFVNFQNHLQLIYPALRTAGNAAWMDLLQRGRLERFGSPFDRWNRYAPRDARPAWQILDALAAALGAGWNYTHPEQVFLAMAKEVPALAGLTYLAIGRRGRRIVPDTPALRPVYSDVLPR